MMAEPKPVRLQLSRAKGFNLQAHSRAINGLAAIVVTRRGKYGNPHRIGFCPVCGAYHTREEAIAEFKAEIALAEFHAMIRDELRGKNLACVCGLDEACHGDVLLEIANG